MSMIFCQGCDRLIDSDYDCDCFIEAGTVEKILCESCREHYEGSDEQQRDLSTRPFTAAQQALVDAAEESDE